MNTQINIDENLVNEVIMLGQCASREEAVVLALQEFIRHRKQHEIIKLFGTLDPDDEQVHLRNKKVVLGIMEGAFSVPDDFDQALPDDDVQREFLAELWQKQRQTFENLAFYLECKQAKDENDFLNEAEAQAFIQSLV
jgi:hypothetical protein